MPPKIFRFTHVGNVLHIGRNARFGFIKSHMSDSILSSLNEIHIGDTDVKI